MLISMLFWYSAVLYASKELKLLKNAENDIFSLSF